jgi:hypothetical protein
LIQAMRKQAAPYRLLAFRHGSRINKLFKVIKVIVMGQTDFKQRS